MTDTMDQWNETFKQGRNAGQADVALEILKHDPSRAHSIAQEFLSRLAGYEPSTHGEFVRRKLDAK
jgi:hypothetical protein